MTTFDPVAAWQPGFGNWFGLTPADMRDLSIGQWVGLFKFIDDNSKAG